ncbi:unnamed protein product [Bursaphelenchus okinawaensis]|uniref:Uncharacterized protein n=1 Tax=Bursaphelenchus okinawaensis TaxID=465554 RepID=A0A811LNU4_9BILA|nr:unnamed protein product [Bursaphelenchus okinawaensis]CAG9127355.1 unnamed protein product [Bursaphelenchus okinawaensis]
MNLKNFILDLRENMNIKKLQRIASILQDFPDATIDLDCSPDFLQWKVLAEMLRYQRINLTVWHYRQIYFFSYWKVDKVLYRRHWTENKHNIYPKALAEIQMKHLSCPIDVLLPFVQNDLQHETIEELELCGFKKSANARFEKSTEFC